MKLVLTVEMLRAAYDLLNITPPFIEWNLPDGEDVIFQVKHYKDTWGTYSKIGKRHEICISTACMSNLQNLIETMAHEMIHLHERQAKARTANHHSKAFRKWAEQVCSIHGFDPKAF